MGVLTGSESRVQSAPSSAEAHPGFAKDLEAAVLRAQENLLRLQKPEGYWNGELLVDSTLVSDTVIYHHWNGKVDKAWQRKAVHHILSMQLPDGGWNIYQGGPSEVNATIKAYLALKLAGVPGHRPADVEGARSGAAFRRRAAHEHVFQIVSRAHRPVLRGNTSRRFRARCCSSANGFTWNFWDMSNWSRAMIVPLAIINHFKPTRPVKVDLDELFPEGIHERDLALAPDPETVSFRNFFLWLDRLHKLAEWFAEHKIHPFRKRALKNAERWMLERFEGSDGLAAIFPAMLNSLIALEGAGLSRRPSASRPCRARVEEARTRNRKRRAHRALLLAGLGHGDCRHLPARVRHFGESSRAQEIRRMADGARNSVLRRLGSQESGQGRGQRLGV